MTCELALDDRGLPAPPVLGTYTLPAVPTAGAVSQDAALREELVLRPSGQWTWLSPGKATTYIWKILEDGCRDLLVLRQPKTGLGVPSRPNPATRPCGEASVFDFPLRLRLCWASFRFHPGNSEFVNQLSGSHMCRPWDHGSPPCTLEKFYSLSVPQFPHLGKIGR